MNLRTYQLEAVNSVIRKIESKEESPFSVLMATGCGKSHVLASILYELLYNKLAKKILVCVPSIAIENQLLNVLSTINVNDHHSLSSIFQVDVVSRLNKEALINSDENSISLSTIQRVRQQPQIINSYNLVILFETPINLKQFTTLQASGSQWLFLGDYFPRSMKQLFGEPLYQYSLEQAIHDGYLEPPEIISLKAFKRNEPVGIDSLEMMLPQLFSNVDEHKKILIFCKDGVDAKNVYDLICNNQIAKSFKGINLITAESNYLEHINELRNNRGPQVAISIKVLQHGYEIDNVTDIILLKNCTTERELIASTKLALRPNSKNIPKTTIWDLYSNNGLIKLFGDSVVDFSDEFNIESKNTPDKTTPHEIIEELFQNNKLIKPSGDSVSNTDYLNRDYLIDTLKGLIEHSSENTQHKPFVFGLFGKWGTGKSTIINLLKHKFIDNKKFKFIEYNAWQNEHCVNVTASIANSITNKLYEKKNLFSRFMLAFKSQVLQQKDTITVSVFLLSLLALLIVLFIDTSKIPLLKNTFVPGIMDEYKYPLSFIAFLTATTWSFFKHPFTSKIKQLAEKPGFAQYLGVSEEIRGQVNALFDASTSINWFWLKNYKPEQYVLVIDDLDRCEHKSILQSLEAVRVLSERPDMIVLICVDKSVLLNSIEKKYQELNISLEEEAHVTARKFLAKVFQLSYELVDDNGLSINTFIENRIYPKDVIPKSSNKKIITKPINTNEGDIEQDDLEYEDDHIEEGVPSSDINNKVEESNEFVEASPGEKEGFVSCVKLFEFNNPRTLIRLHNTITLIKGMYSKKVNTSDKFPSLIFATFLYEYMCNNSHYSYLESMILKEEKVKEYMKSTSIDYKSTEFQELMNIVSKASLPSSIQITP